MIKLCAYQVGEPLQIIFKNNTDTETIPVRWNKTNVTPKHKLKEKQILYNHRPLCFLPLFSKIFERYLIRNRIDLFSMKAKIQITMTDIH